MKYVWESGGVKRWKANRPQLAYPLHSTPKNLLMNFQRVSYYLLLLGVALRIPAKLQNGYDDSHGQPAQQDNKHAACCRFQTWIQTNRKDGQAIRKGNEPQTIQERERARQTDNRSLIKHTVWLDDAAKGACCVWDNNRIYKKHVCKRRSKAKKRERFFFFLKRFCASRKETDRYFQRPRHWLSTLYSYRLGCRRRPCPSTTCFVDIGRNNKKKKMNVIWKRWLF